MSTLQIKTARVFAPLLQAARYKGAFGGRGSGKSHFFAELLVERCLIEKTDWVCIREVQKTLNQSAKKLIETKIEAFGVGHLFEVQSSLIKTPFGGQIIFQGMQDHTADSIKSLEGFDGAWIEEAQSLSQRSLDLLRPTIRKEQSELWFSWNPRNKRDPVDVMFRGDKKPSDVISVNANWRDNPEFPNVLEQERLDCFNNEPDKYGHIWEGEYEAVTDGAYYARHINEAKNANRICGVPKDNLQPVRVFCDIGGTSGRSDAFVMMVTQRIGLEKRCIDYYEVVGQEFSEHVHWLHTNGYSNAIIMLPHDGNKHDNVYRVTPRSYFEQAGFKVEVMPNEGHGAAMLRIEAGRRDFPNWYFDKDKASGLLEALSHYHERKDDIRGIGLGINHDWSSHGADAWGGACVWYESNQPVKHNNINKIKRVFTNENAWLGA